MMKWMVVWTSMLLKLVQGPNGERYMVAWMQMWQRSIPSHDLAHGWAGSMTLPRKLGP